VTCAQEPLPSGWRVWRGPVPAELAQLAMDVRDHVRRYTRGTIVQTVTYQGTPVGVFVSSHTWTYRGGTLVTGICIPGVSLVVPVGQTGVGDTGSATTDLSTPDPTLAVFGAPETTDWGAVAVSATVILGLSAAFAWAIRGAGRAARR
jgi:hypothetical protein